MADKRIIDLGAATTLINQQMEIAGADGISHKTPFINPATKVASVTGAGVDNTDPLNPVISSVQSVVAGTNITVDNTDPENPVVSATGGGAVYLVYTAVLGGSNSNPVQQTQFSNTIGDGSGDGVNDIRWTDAQVHFQNGQWQGNMSSGTPFPANKVFILVSNGNNGGQIIICAAYRVFNNRITIYLFDDAGNPVNPFCNLFVEIRVYP